MKKIVALTFITMTSILNAQVIIGNNVGSAAVKTSVLLEFATNTNKGIILPYVRVIPTNPTEGTLLLDVSNPLTSRVKYYNGSWIDLSGQDADIRSHLTHQPTVIQAAELNNSKTIIGASRTNADGVLVLESTTRTMILPIVNDVRNISNPSPGMMVYINKANAKRLAVFNGSKWSFWRP